MMTPEEIALAIEAEADHLFNSGLYGNFVSSVIGKLRSLAMYTRSLDLSYDAARRRWVMEGLTASERKLDELARRGPHVGG
jgi:hypothetical protein